jgi:hypothetical protein
MSKAPFDWTGFFAQTWPSLLMYLAGFVIALVMMGQHRTPGILAIIAMILLLSSMFSPPLINWMIDPNQSSDSIRRTYGLMGMVTNLLRAAGAGLLLWAAFAGRPRNFAEGHGFGVMPPPQYPHGMQYRAPHNPGGYGGGTTSPGGSPPGGHRGV